MMNIHSALKYMAVVAVAAMALTGCRHQNDSLMKRGTTQQDIVLLRLEPVIFGTPTDQLQAKLNEVRTDFRTPMLNIFPEDPKFMEQVKGMAQDPTMREVYDSVMALYPDLEWLRKELQQGMKNLGKASQNIHCNRVYTFISGDFDYEHRAVADMEDGLLVAIDQYTTSHFEKYGYFGLPKYLAKLLDKQYLATDCMSAIVKARIPIPDRDLTMLDYMVAEGKALYCTRLAFPKVEDSILLRYSSEQLAWAEHNVADVWAYIIQHKLLYETDYNEFNNILDDAPKTNAFGDKSAPRMAAYIGYQIVKEFAQGRSADLERMLENTESQSILQQSGWKPVRSRR